MNTNTFNKGIYINKYIKTVRKSRNSNTKFKNKS